MIGSSALRDCSRRASTARARLAALGGDRAGLRRRRDEQRRDQEQADEDARAHPEQFATPAVIP